MSFNGLSVGPVWRSLPYDKLRGWVSVMVNLPREVQDMIYEEVFKAEREEFGLVQHGVRVQPAGVIGGMMTEPTGFIREYAEEQYVKTNIFWASIRARDLNTAALQAKLTAIRRLNHFKQSAKHMKFVLAVHFDRMNRRNPQPTLALLGLVSLIIGTTEVLRDLPLCSLDHHGQPQGDAWVAVLPVVNRTQDGAGAGFFVGPLEACEQQLLALVRSAARTGAQHSHWSDDRKYHTVQVLCDLPPSADDVFYGPMFDHLWEEWRVLAN